VALYNEFKSFTVALVTNLQDNLIFMQQNNPSARRIEELTTQWLEWLENPPAIFTSLVESVIIILVLVAIRFIILRIVNRRWDDPTVLYKWRKNLSYALSFIGFLMVGRIWFEGIGSLATFLGLLSAGIAIALRDPLLDIAGWMYLLWRKPFQVGDRIQMGEDTGDVIDIRLFKFSLLEVGHWVHADQSTGRVLHVPNHHLFNLSIANYTSNFDFIWNEVEVVITFDSNWKEAKRLLQEIGDRRIGEMTEMASRQLQQAARSYVIRFSYLTPIVYTEADTGGIKLTLRHLCDPRKRRTMTMEIWEEILESFQDRQDIELAYRSFRVFESRKAPLDPEGASGNPEVQ